MPEHRRTQKSVSGNIENIFAISEAVLFFYRIMDDIPEQVQLAKTENVQVLL